MLRHLRNAGLSIQTFGYLASLERFASIQQRLAKIVSEIAESRPYVVVGHSLGGVLIRSALSALPENVKPPEHVFLLGSPMQSSRLATQMRRNPLYRTLTGDCGQLLASPERMKEIGALSVRTTGIAGIRGLTGHRSPFGHEPNDGVVSLSEVSAPWLSTQLQIPVIHTWLPASRRVAEIILQQIASEPRVAAG